LQAATGLPNGDVFDVFVDSQNRVWISTESGLAMYEGSDEPKIYDNRNGIPNRRCRAVAELNDKIYVATWGNGIGVGDSAAIYDESETPVWSVLDMDSGLVTDRVYDLAVDDSSLWIATVEGMCQYIDNENLAMEDRWVDYTSTVGPGVFTSIIVAETVNRGTEVWMSESIRDSAGTMIPGGIRALRFPGSQYYSTATSGIPSDNVNGVAYDPTRDFFWSAHATHGAASVDVDASMWTQYSRTEGLHSNLGSAVDVNHLDKVWTPGTVWIATQAGLTKMDPDGKITNYIHGSGLLNERVRKVYVDENDEVWLAFVDKGAAKVIK
jgi:ligand-binding sensor domain-containing protein